MEISIYLEDTTRDIFFNMNDVVICGQDLAFMEFITCIAHLLYFWTIGYLDVGAAIYILSSAKTGSNA
jgi:hypothetical protein